MYFYFYETRLISSLFFYTGDYVKVWKDADEVIKPTVVPKELWEIENTMKEKPKKWDKKKQNNYHKNI